MTWFRLAQKGTKHGPTHHDTRSFNTEGLAGLKTLKQDSLTAANTDLFTELYHDQRHSSKYVTSTNSFLSSEQASEITKVPACVSMRRQIMFNYILLAGVLFGDGSGKSSLGSEFSLGWQIPHLWLTRARQAPGLPSCSCSSFFLSTSFLYSSSSWSVSWLKGLGTVSSDSSLVSASPLDISWLSVD